MFVKLGGKYSNHCYLKGGSTEKVNSSIHKDLQFGPILSQLSHIYNFKNHGVTYIYKIILCLSSMLAALKYPCFGSSNNRGDKVQNVWSLELFLIGNAVLSKTKSSTVRILWLRKITVIGLNYLLV